MSSFFSITVSVLCKRELFCESQRFCFNFYTEIVKFLQWKCLSWLRFTCIYILYRRYLLEKTGLYWPSNKPNVDRSFLFIPLSFQSRWFKPAFVYAIESFECVKRLVYSSVITITNNIFFCNLAEPLPCLLYTSLAGAIPEAAAICTVSTIMSD